MAALLHTSIAGCVHTSRGSGDDKSSTTVAPSIPAGIKKKFSPSLFHSWTNFLYLISLGQGSTLTFQLTSQVASDNVDVTTISVCLPAKLANGNRKSPAKTEFLLVCG